MTDTPQFTPADCLPCIHCGEQPEAWQGKSGNWCVLCFCQGPRGAANCLSLEDAVAAWNRLNANSKKDVVA